MSCGAIVVVGGTGAVGRELVGLLAGGPDEVVVVARDGASAGAVAAAAARAQGGAVSARRADVSDPADRRAAVAGAQVVVLCVERANALVARDALENGADVVDISASAPVLGSVAALEDVARWHRRSAVTDVGLAPGLTNLLARACVDRLPGATGVDITVLVGLGERHGADAVRWTVDGLAAPASATAVGAVSATAVGAASATAVAPASATAVGAVGAGAAGSAGGGAGGAGGAAGSAGGGAGGAAGSAGSGGAAGGGAGGSGGAGGAAGSAGGGAAGGTGGPVGSASPPLPARVAIPGFGERLAHPFPFADQASLRASLGIPVTTRLCFDSRWLTAAAFALRPAVRRLSPRGRRAVARAAARTHVGDDRWAVQVRATAPGDRTATAHASGRRQSHATAVVTAHVVGQLRAGTVPPGAVPIHDAVDVDKALAEVEAAGITVHRP